MKKYCTLILVIGILLLSGCYNTRELNAYIKENLSQFEITTSNKVKNDYSTAEETLYYYWNVTINDGINKEFQVYKYQACYGEEACKIKFKDNYTYIYSDYLLNEFKKDNNIRLDLVFPSTIKDNFITADNVLALYSLEKDEKVEDAKTKIDEFKKYINSRVKRNISISVSIKDTDGNTTDYVIN